ncbi:hypothetical protein DRO61_09915, partial [Candidatus Bathyarchaeota archaeon]
ATGAIFGLVNAIKAATVEAVKFERELSKVAQVSSVSIGSLKGLSEQIFSLSTGLGVSSSSLLTASRTLKQAGLSATEVKNSLEALAKTELAPTFDNIATTTEGAIAVLRQFRLEATDLESVLGSINKVAGQFAVESSDIIAAIRRAGGVFSAAAGDEADAKRTVNEFIGLFTSVRATTRETAESIAVGLRTVFSRLQRRTTIDALKALGIELTTLEGKFIGPFKAVEELSKGLRGLASTDIRFAAIVEELGGIRQIGKIIPLIKEFATAQKAFQVAQKGQQSLGKDAEVAQQTLQVQLTKTKEKFLELVNAVTQTSTFKGLASGLLAITNNAIGLANVLKPLIPALAVFAGFKLAKASLGFIRGFKGGVGGQASNKRELERNSSAERVNTSATIQNTTAQNQQTATQRASASAQASLVSATRANIAALNLNTSAVSRLATIMGTRSISLNPSRRRRNGGGPIRRFNRGGLIPGSSESDTVDIKAMPGEFMLNKRAVDKIGVDNLRQLNNGGGVDKYTSRKRVGNKKIEKGIDNDFGLRSLFQYGDTASVNYDFQEITSEQVISAAKNKSRKARKLINNSLQNKSGKSRGILFEEAGAEILGRTLINSSNPNAPLDVPNGDFKLKDRSEVQTTKLRADGAAGKYLRDSLGIDGGSENGRQSLRLFTPKIGETKRVGAVDFFIPAKGRKSFLRELNDYKKSTRRGQKTGRRGGARQELAGGGTVEEIRRDLRNLITDPAFTPTSEGRITGKDKSGFLLEQSDKKLGPERQKDRNKLISKIEGAKRIKDITFGAAFLRPSD